MFTVPIHHYFRDAKEWSQARLCGTVWAQVSVLASELRALPFVEDCVQSTLSFVVHYISMNKQIAPRHFLSHVTNTEMVSSRPSQRHRSIKQMTQDHSSGIWKSRVLGQCLCKDDTKVPLKTCRATFETLQTHWRITGSRGTDTEKHNTVCRNGVGGGVWETEEARVSPVLRMQNP